MRSKFSDAKLLKHALIGDTYIIVTKTLSNWLHKLAIFRRKLAQLRSG